MPPLKTYCCDDVARLVADAVAPYRLAPPVNATLTNLSPAVAEALAAANPEASEITHVEMFVPLLLHEWKPFIGVMV